MYLNFTVAIVTKQMTSTSTHFPCAFKTELLFDISHFLALALWPRCVRIVNMANENVSRESLKVPRVHPSVTFEPFQGPDLLSHPSGAAYEHKTYLRTHTCNLTPNYDNPHSYKYPVNRDHGE